MPSAAILAGGRASRFAGRDKSSLVVGGVTIRERQTRALAGVVDELLIVGDRDEDHGPAPTTGGESEPIRRISDRVRNCGPLGGLDAALAAARYDPLVLLACDMPFVTPGLIAYLLSLAGTADAVVPRTERGYHPLCAAYTRACRPAVEARLTSGHLAMTGLLEQVRVRDVTGEELERLGGRRLLMNVNTAADYQELERRFGHEA
jgi:molybdopterin-guanine dinucleotide biosynthesis protein A